MESQIEHSPEERKNADDTATAFDFTYVKTTARIAVYDDLRSAPRIVEIPPGPTNEYIEALASTTFDYAKRAGGSIPYTVIREVSENFIHARFAEIVVSILDEDHWLKQSVNETLASSMASIEKLREVEGITQLLNENEYIESSNIADIDTGEGIVNVQINTISGLYQQVYEGQMVQAFNDWCFDETRASGDTGIVQSDYGYHIMYYVGQGDLIAWQETVRDALRSADYTAWEEELVGTIESAELKDGASYAV